MRLGGQDKNQAPRQSSPLLRFLDKESGPIVRLESSPYPGIFRTSYWYSLAYLHSGIAKRSEPPDVLTFSGAGWSPNKQESQEKAIVEAVERWAYRSFSSSSPDRAGLSIDPTSNGFAAL